MNKSIILLSAGLDSLVSLGICKDEYNIELALTFDYGQKSAKDEINSSEKICKYYDIKHEIVKLDFLKNITTCSIVTNKPIPTGIELENSQKSAKSVWVPNRNGLFLNIAGSYADSYGFTHIIIGANKEEAETFSDNTKEFINSVNTEFQYSTQVHPKIIAPLINLNKNDIVNLAITNEIPLDNVMSCYQGRGYHCGMCESCIRLKNALIYNRANTYIKKLFESKG